MRTFFGWLGENIWLLLILLFAVAFWLHGSGMYDSGYGKAQAEGESALQSLRLEYAEQSLRASQENLASYRLQVQRANEAELRYLDAQGEIRQLQQQLTRERIAHVSTQYRPAPGTAPVPAPRFVITCGWLRDFNAALGARMPAPAGCRGAAGAAPGAWPAAGSDAELLESGVSAADILAHARDYGAWALTNLAQLNGFRRLHKESP
ncbi:lysis protein [Pseudomonas alcaligenes]|uniref:lysis protein n=1 Tax=Aquipseudomonas alcaligenes TaxID=43263 RepID=UPI00358F6151